jgi:hypothetical protein
MVADLRTERNCAELLRYRRRADAKLGTISDLYQGRLT